MVAHLRRSDHGYTSRALSAIRKKKYAFKKNWALWLIGTGLLMGWALAALVPEPAYAQAPAFLWAKSAGGEGDDEGLGIAVDSSGNAYATGWFSSATITFGSTTLTNAGANSRDVFVVKYDPTGNVLWVRSAGGKGEDEGRGITIDSSGNAYVTGWFSSATITFGSTTLTNAGSDSPNVFVVKYGRNGNVLWAKNLGNASGDEGFAIAVDSAGNAYVTVVFTGSSITFGSTTLNAGFSAVFVAKYDSNGNILWAKSAGGAEGDEGFAIAVDSAGNAYVTGFFTSATITFGSTTLTNVSHGSGDIFVTEYDPDGNVLWALSAGGTDYDFGAGIAVDSSGYAYVIGYSVSPTITFGSIALTNTGSYDIFVAKIGLARGSNGQAGLPQMNSGAIWTWGSDNHGQLGNGATDDHHTPIQISNLTGVIAVAGGDTHSLALKSDGTVWAWGNNPGGLLGIGSTNTISSTPAQVVGLTGVIAVAGGQLFSLALKSDGTVWAWGANPYGELGNGSTAPSSTTPVQVSYLTGIIGVAAGTIHALAVKSDGTVWAWGGSQFGQVGNAITGDRTNLPFPIAGLRKIIAASAGGDHNLALKYDGTVWAWGGNSYGQLGNGTTSVSSINPVQVVGLDGVTAVAAGTFFSLALKSDRTVWAWGSNSYGQLGNGTTIDSSTAIQLSGLTGVIAIAAAGDHALALKSDGTVWTWGGNGAGQLGNGTVTNSTIPVQVSGLDRVTAVAAGSAHSLALVSQAGSMTGRNEQNLPINEKRAPQLPMLVILAVVGLLVLLVGLLTLLRIHL